MSNNAIDPNQGVDREEEIDLIVNLLQGEKRRVNNTTPIKWLFGILIGLGLLYGIGHGGYYLYDLYRVKTVGEWGFKVEKVDLQRSISLGGHDTPAYPNKQEGYTVFLPDRSWFDSGIWVNTGLEAVVKTVTNKEKQPFIVKIGNKQIPATLSSDNLYFVAKVKPESPGKLIFKLSDDAAIRYINLEVWIIRPPEGGANEY